jgi:uncharacterized protein YcsI (UPF0317 family)
MSERHAETANDLRMAARAGFEGLTVGRARGYVQANLFLLPAGWADEFEAFCRANSQACPLLARGEAGVPTLSGLGADIDLRTDLPAYLIHRHGRTDRVTDLSAVWRNDLVPVAVGCWFGAEAALAARGIRMRHVELGLQGSLFCTDRSALPVGRLFGPLVVSMRPFAAEDVAAVTHITAMLPLSHGAPVHVGDAAVLGISRVDTPDWGEVLLPEAGEVSMFWACGLTALAALQAADVPFFITHAPGAMLVTDLREELPQ